MMDLLQAAGYDSSSSSSSSSQPCKNNVTLREDNAPNSINGHAPKYSSRPGSVDDNSQSKADGNASKRRGFCHSPKASTAVKKQKLAQSITIASFDIDCQQSDLSFERCNPHWEGRWAGHIYLPFPNMEASELCDAPHAPTHVESKNGTEARILADDHSDSDSDSIDEDDVVQSSQRFLPTARTLIHYWAALLNEAYVDDEDATGIVIVPHVSMSPKKATSKSIQTAKNQDIKNKSNTCLHISLSRPVYLPAPSVDSFLADISSSMALVHSASRRHGQCNSQKGRTIHLRPKNATIFINDNQTRSFLSIPLSEESSRWAKRLLLPSIDAAMLRYGQKTYYDDGIMHVSIASVKGNMIPITLHKRRNKDSKESAYGNESSITSIPLFQTQGCNQSGDETRNSIPESISIRLDHIQCDFGKVKNMLLPL
ncbi:hypothetical protein ACHAXM_011681 [Skeletonema potamos]|jgi:hypothetical protein